MLRIRLANGNIRELNDSQELAAALAAGEVGPDAQIYHARSGRWLPVTDHPVFRKGTAAPPPAPGGGPVSPAEPTGHRDQPPTPIAEPNPPPASGVEGNKGGQLQPSPQVSVAASTSAAPGIAPKGEIPPSLGPEPVGEPPAPPSKATPPPTPPPRPAAEPPRNGPPVIEMQTRSGAELAARRRFAWRVPATLLLLAVGLITGGLYLTRRSGSGSPDAAVRPTTGVTPNRPVVRPVPRDTSTSSTRTVQTPSEGVPPQALADHHAKLADSLDTALEEFTRKLGLMGFLATARLASAESVRTSRGALNRFTAGLATYRAQQQALSKLYNDSADAFVLSGAWDRGALQEWQVRVRRPEPPALVARADALVASLDSLLGLLLEHQGAYEITPTVIRFQAPRASLQYDDLVRAVNANRVNATERRSAPLSVLGEAMTGAKLPPTSGE